MVKLKWNATGAAAAAGRRAVLAAVTVGVLASGCAGCSEDGDAPEPTGTPPSPSSAPSGSVAPRVELRDDLAEVFREAGTKGTFVLYAVRDNRVVVVDRARAERALTPASTFKVPHSLIALETGVVKDENEKIPYGGQPQTIKEWERDMGLREAIKISNVPVFQEIARRVGAQREREWMSRLGYGNAEVGGAVDRFWLDGSLRISALDQALWLRRLARQELPASVEHQLLVRDLVRLDEIGDPALYGKTGTAASVTPQLQWWVGWVEAGDDLYCFALNMDVPSDPETDRVTLGRAFLRRLRVLPASAS